MIPTLDEVVDVDGVDSGFFQILAFQVLAGYIIYLFAGIYSFLSSINYVSLNIDIAPMLLKFYFTFPDWTRQHPATNRGTGNCGPFSSTSHYLQVQLSTVFHRACRP